MFSYTVTVNASLNSNLTTHKALFTLITERVSIHSDPQRLTHYPQVFPSALVFSFPLLWLYQALKHLWRQNQHLIMSRHIYIHQRETLFSDEYSGLSFKTQSGNVQTGTRRPNFFFFLHSTRLHSTYFPEIKPYVISSFFFFFLLSRYTPY